jgi:hypothetical protein
MRKVVHALCILTVSCLLIPLATAEEGTNNFEWYDPAIRSHNLTL